MYRLKLYNKYFSKQVLGLLVQLFDELLLEVPCALDCRELPAGQLFHVHGAEDARVQTQSLLEGPAAIYVAGALAPVEELGDAEPGGVLVRLLDEPDEVRPLRVHEDQLGR